MKDSITFDELMNSTSEELQLKSVSAVKTPLARKKKELSEMSDDEIQAKLDKERMLATSMNRDDVGESYVDKLGHDVTEGLKFYIKKLPQFQILDKQITLLKEEMENYKKNGSQENYEKSKQMIFNLNGNLSELKKIIKTGQTTNSAEDKNKLYEKIKNSEIINNLLEQKKLLKKELAEATTSWWIKQIKEYRQRIKLNSSISEDILDFDDLENLDLKKEEKITQIEQEYYDFCGKLADILDWAVNDILDSSISQLEKALNDTLPLTLTWEIKNKLVDIDSKISYEKDLLSGTTQITDLIYEVFDFEKPEDVKISKELLALSNIGYVKSIAYNVCRKYNSLNKLDDAVSAGLEGLSKAINRWTTKQSLAGNPISFKGFAATDINMSIQRELLNLDSQGTASGSTVATINHFNKKKINNFIKDNPQFADVDISIVMELLLANDSFDENEKSGVKKVNKIITATDFTGMVGGDEEGTDDIFENSTSSDDNVAEMLEGKLAYERMMKSISDILNLFDTKLDSKTGITKITEKKLFDKYDRKIFMMYFGLQHRLEKVYDDEGNEVTRNSYTQTEIAEELFILMKSDGHTLDKPFSQAAIKYRIDQILLKLKKALEIKPELKTGFEYFINIRKTDNEKTGEKTGNWRLNNPDLLKKLSNSREEIGMKIDRDELKDIYSNNQNAMNRQLSDGKKLSDVFQVSDTNPLDEEIASMFGDL